MNTQSLYEQRQNFFLTPNATLRGGLIFCILIGIVTFIAGMVVADAQTRTWGSYLFNLFFFFSLALGGSAFSGMQDVISATWGRPVMRLHEAFVSFLPVAVLMFAVFFLCIFLKVGRAQDVYAWIRDPELVKEMFGKRDWLQPGFMMIRDMFVLLVMLGLALWQLRLKLGRDMALVRGDVAKAKQLGLEAMQKLRYWSSPVLVFYAVGFSILGFDLLMSLAPKWNSTLWGGWTFATMMQSLMASLLIFMYAMRRTTIGQVIRRHQFHDVGKLMHGFTIFFAYLTYAHIITYWYGNMPEETSYFIHRLHGPWLAVLLTAFVLVFIFPLFALLPKASKWTAALTLPICASILVAQWLIQLLIVIPQTVEDSAWTLPWIEVGAFLGFLGLFLSCIFWFGKRFPMVSVADPLLAVALADHQH